jgi:LysM repeat protein
MKNHLLVALTVASLLSAGFCIPDTAHASEPFCHVVKPGETLTQIAQRYGIPVETIVEVNNLWNPNTIYPGQCILIPQISANCEFSHTVKRGEYLKLIAARYGVSVAALVQANGLRNPNLIYTGQRLKIPCTSAPPPPSDQACTKTYRVKRGEYLKLIAARFGVSVWEIVRANGLSNPNLVYPGQRLRIPCVGPAPKPQPTPTPQPGPWRGQYWDNRDQSGDPTVTRYDQLVNFSWGEGRPHKRIGKDDFSARWERTRQLDAGSYRFHVKADDGVRFWLDGELLIDQWHTTPPTEYTVDKQLEGGSYELQVDYFEYTGNAQVRFWIESLDPPIPDDAWLAEYFPNRFFEPPATIARHESEISYDWGTDPPEPGFRPDDFTVRWTRDLWLEGGDYRFTVEVDDGVELLVDGVPIIAEWHDSNGATYSQETHLGKGTHRVQVRFYEGTGSARINVAWAKLPMPNPWKGEYFNNMQAQGTPVLTRDDDSLDFDWKKGSPATGVTADYFSARWTGDVVFAEGVYRFHATADDGIRVYLDGSPILDEWHDTSPATYWVDRAIAAGTHHVKVEYYEREGTAVAKVWWTQR